MSWYLRLTFLLLSLSLTLFARERGALAEDAGPVEPQVSPASREGELAKAGIKVPEGIEVSLYAAEPLLANPVAFGFDSQGRIYVCETFRQQQGVEDNRSHMVWLEDDLAARSVADRVAFFRKHLGEGIADYGKQQDRIRRLEDTNRDGVADISTVFAGPFREIEEGTGAGVLAVGDDVYYTNIPRLWRLKDADGNGVADEQDALADGFGVRVAFRGHDMHGLTLGPDGRIYFSIGDRGYNVTTQEGKRLVRPDTGAVFRCERDGSNLEVFAYGLRNPQELAFDDYGNLFTGDNNSDSGDQARWVHVVEGSDTGWRMYFQYLPDRGPWNRERMWYAHQADDETTRVQPTYIVPPITNIADGPSGLAYYPGVGLPDRYNGHFFLADFRGSTSRSGVRSFGLEPHGATYKLTDEHWFIENLLVTDVDFGYDGKMYVTDWVDGWNGPGKGRIYAFTSPAQADAVREAKVADRVSLGFDAGETSELVSLLSHPDRRVRQGAQMALAHHDDVEPLTNLAVDRNSPRIARIHAIWGAWQMAIEKGGIDLHFADIFPRLAADNDPEIRAQALRVFGDLRDAGAVDALIRATQHGTPREQYFAAIALGRIGSENMMDGRERLDAFCELLAKNNDADPVLRHAAVMGLTGCGTPALLLERIDHESAAVRLGAVLALRRHHAGEVAQFLHDADSRVVEEAARAIHDEPIAEALPFLAALIERPASEMSDLLLRRVINANYRLGGPSHAAAVARLIGDEAAPEGIKSEAVFALLHWHQPPTLDRVTNEFRPLPARSIDAASDAVRSLVPQLLVDEQHRRAAIELIARYRLTGHESQLLAILRNATEPADVQATALTALLQFDGPETRQALDFGVTSKTPEVRMAAHSGLVGRDPQWAAAVLFEAVGEEQSTVAERQHALSLLPQVEHPLVDLTLKSMLEELQHHPDQIPAEIQLDLLTAAERRGGDELTLLLKQFDAARDSADPLGAFRACLHGGDVGRGKEIFFGNAAASCRRCHKVNGDGSDVGPDLSGIAKTNNREYLLESILNPNARIAKGFETVVFVMDDGQLYTGLVKGEDEETYQLMTAQGELIRVEKSGIEERAVGKSGMPEDVAKPLSKADLRDLVEYLSTLQTPASNDAAHGKEGQ